MIGQTLGQYMIVEALGRGAMGIVYRAFDTRLERSVAIKVLGTSDDASDDEPDRVLRRNPPAA